MASHAKHVTSLPCLPCLIVMEDHTTRHVFVQAPQPHVHGTVDKHAPTLSERNISHRPKRSRSSFPRQLIGGRMQNCGKLHSTFGPAHGSPCQLIGQQTGDDQHSDSANRGTKVMIQMLPTFANQQRVWLMQISTHV